jgi:hypothetical protein
MIDEANDADAAGKCDTPAKEECDDVDRCPRGGHDVQGQPFGDELARDKNGAGDGEWDQGKRDQEEGAEAALQECPTVGWEIVSAPDAFHKGGNDAGGADQADYEGGDKTMRGMSAVRGVDEVAL